MSRGVSFNENVTYKNRLITNMKENFGENIAEEEALEDFTETIVDKNNVNIEADTKTEAKHPASYTANGFEKISITTSPLRFSSSINLLLPAEDGEFQCYSKVVQMGDSV